CGRVLGGGGAVGGRHRRLVGRRADGHRDGADRCPALAVGQRVGEAVGAEIASRRGIQHLARLDGDGAVRGIGDAGDRQGSAVGVAVVGEDVDQCGRVLGGGGAVGGDRKSVVEGRGVVYGAGG